MGHHSYPIPQPTFSLMHNAQLCEGIFQCRISARLKYIFYPFFYSVEKLLVIL